MQKYAVRLVQISSQVEMLSFAVKNVTGKSLLIFYNRDLPVHAEGIIEGKFSEYCQGVIQQYLTSYLTIIEMKIVAK